MLRLPHAQRRSSEPRAGPRGSSRNLRGSGQRSPDGRHRPALRSRRRHPLSPLPDEGHAARGAAARRPRPVPVGSSDQPRAGRDTLGCVRGFHSSCGAHAGGEPCIEGVDAWPRGEEPRARGETTRGAGVGRDARARRAALRRAPRGLLPRRPADPLQRPRRHGGGRRSGGGRPDRPVRRHHPRRAAGAGPHAATRRPAVARGSHRDYRLRASRRATTFPRSAPPPTFRPSTRPTSLSERT